MEDDKISEVHSHMLNNSPLPAFGAFESAEKLAGCFSLPPRDVPTWQIINKAFRKAVDERRPFCLSIPELTPLERQARRPYGLYVAQNAISSPLAGREMPLFVPKESFLQLTEDIVGESEFIRPFYDLLMNREERIGVRRNPTDVKVSDLEAHYNPVALASMLAAQNVWQQEGFNLPGYSKSFDPVRYMGILGLMHDWVEDGIFALEELRGIGSPYTNDHLFRSLLLLTRKSIPDSINGIARMRQYTDYGNRIGSDPLAEFLVRVKLTDQHVNIAYDYVNGATFPEGYIRKQIAVASAMGNSLVHGLGKSMSRARMVDQGSLSLPDGSFSFPL